MLGTRLWATHQAMGAQEKKDDLVTADADDAVRSKRKPKHRRPFHNNSMPSRNVLSIPFP